MSSPIKTEIHQGYFTQTLNRVISGFGFNFSIAAFLSSSV
jgi:hypothetical protein